MFTTGHHGNDVCSVHEGLVAAVWHILQHNFLHDDGEAVDITGLAALSHTIAKYLWCCPQQLMGRNIAPCMTPDIVQPIVTDLHYRRHTYNYKLIKKFQLC